MRVIGDLDYRRQQTDEERCAEVRDHDRRRAELKDELDRREFEQLDAEQTGRLETIMEARREIASAQSYAAEWYFALEIDDDAARSYAEWYCKSVENENREDTRPECLKAMVFLHNAVGDLAICRHHIWHPADVVFALMATLLAARELKSYVDSSEYYVALEQETDGHADAFVDEMGERVRDLLAEVAS